MGENVSAKIESLDTSLAGKVVEIIEAQWGRRLEDVKDLSIEQFYERFVKEGRISYRPINRFVLQTTFRTVRNPRRVTFYLTA